MARIDPPERPGALARLTAWYARRQYGRNLAPADVWSHTPGILVGYGAMELAFERSRRLDPMLRLLAELKASTVAGCEWCTARFNYALGIESQNFSEGSFCAIPERGSAASGQP
jgi:alkylhydroperoxidase family enzyme